MIKGTLRCAAVLAIWFAITAAIPVQAQINRDTGGVKLGALTIFPSAIIGARFSDNIFFVPEDEADREDRNTRDKESDFIVNVQPALLLDVTAGTFTFQTGYQYYGDIYTGYDDEDDNHDELNANNHAFRALISYQAPVGFFLELKDRFLLQETFTSSDEYVDYLLGDQKHNDGKFTVGYRTLPGDTVYFGASYRNVWDTYDEEDFQIYDRMAHLVELDFRLKFFPRTAFVIEGDGGTIRNPDNEDFNNIMYGGMAGIIGNITRHLLLTVKGGFTVWDYVAGEDYQNYLAQGEIAGAWPAFESRVAAGYDHGVVDATDTNFRVADEIYLEYHQGIIQRFAIDLRGSYMFNTFSKPNDRDEQFLQARLDFVTRVLFWFHVGAGYSYERKLIAPGEDDEVEINRHIGMLRLIFKL